MSAPAAWGSGAPLVLVVSRETRRYAALPREEIDPYQWMRFSSADQSLLPRRRTR